MYDIPRLSPRPHPLLKGNFNLVTIYVILRYAITDLEKLINFRQF